MQAVPTLSFTNRARADIARITSELSDLQRQTASGRKAEDLQGLGSGATRTLTAASLLNLDRGRIAQAQEIDARLGIQGATLSQAAESVNTLASAVRNAAITGDGGFLGPELEFAFAGLTSAMNQTYNGQSLFAGERVDTPPVKAKSLNDLIGVSYPEDLFNEGVRRQTLDLGENNTVELADKASEISWKAYEAMRDLKGMLDAAGGRLPNPLPAADVNKLLTLADALAAGGSDIRGAEGRNGLVQGRVEDTVGRLERRSLVLEQDISLQTSSDLAEVALRLNALQTQYQATAQTFSQLSRLTLLEFLR